MNAVKSVLVALCLALAGCASGPDPALHVEALLALDHEFARYSREHGAASAFERYLADDAIQLPADRDVVKGRVSIVDGLRALDDGWVLDWTPVHAELSQDASMGYTWGRWELYKAENPGTKILGKYLNVWRRGPDGRWRVIADIGNEKPKIPD